MIAERVGEDKRAVASVEASVVRFRRVLERWRSKSLLIAWISMFMVLCAVVGSPKGPSGLAHDHVSQSGEIATLPVRRCEGPTFDTSPDDDHSAKVPHGERSRGASVERELSAAPAVAEHRNVARVGPSSPRGPPLCFV